MPWKEPIHEKQPKTKEGIKREKGNKKGDNFF